ncbi:hypothetical protein LJC62_02800 [Odoribacter sp. OttesenSCG-928-A06]|nr:hypothetical protein [Odoribacter sp. OttesenSCG-928-A06]
MNLACQINAKGMIHKGDPCGIKKNYKRMKKGIIALFISLLTMCVFFSSCDDEDYRPNELYTNNALYSIERATLTYNGVEERDDITYSYTITLYSSDYKNNIGKSTGCRFEMTLFSPTKDLAEGRYTYVTTPVNATYTLVGTLETPTVVYDITYPYGLDLIKSGEIYEISFDGYLFDQNSLDVNWQAGYYKGELEKIPSKF